MKNQLSALALTLPLLLVGCSETSTTEEASSNSPSPNLDVVSLAGGEKEILSVAVQATGFCHQETTYKGTPIAESPYVANEFQGAYVEEGGRYVRHIIAGTIDVEDGPEEVVPVGYSCAYIQRQTTDAPAVEDNLGIVFEDEAIEYSEGGYSLADLRDSLRSFHEVNETDTAIIVSADSYEDAASGWVDESQQMETTKSSRSETYDDPLTFMLDGTYLVGKDVVPGTYEASEAGASCYWARLSGLSGETTDIIANDSRAISPIVTLYESDVAFKSSNCGLWMQVK